jgi:hypothetical protein
MTETRERPRAAYPELEGEADVELGRYAAAVAARWWLPLLGLLVGLIAGWVISVGGEDVYRASALIDMGTPLSPSGAPLPSIAPAAGDVREIVASEAAIRRAARESGVAARDLRGAVSVQRASGARGEEPTLVNVRVDGDAPGRAARAANELARVAVAGIGSGYIAAKIRNLEAQIAAANAELRSIDRSLDALLARDDLASITAAAVLQQRRTSVEQTKLDRQNLLSLAESVERPRIVEPAVARKVTAQSRRNQLVVAGAIGLLLGILAALLWEPLVRRRAAP